MLEEQEDLQRKYFYRPEALTTEQKVNLSKEYLLSAHSEVDEVLNEIPWKTHKSYENFEEHTDVELLTEEIVDCMKFLMNILVIWHVNDEKLYEVFMTKSKKVREKLEKK